MTDASEESTTEKVQVVVKKSVVWVRKGEKFKDSIFSFPVLLVGEVAGANLFMIFRYIGISFQIIADPIASFWHEAI